MDIYKSRIFAESWNVAYRKKQEGAPLDQLEETFIVIKNPYRYWAADPFLFEKESDVYIFAELYDYVLARGVIGYIHLNSDTPKWTPVIKEKYHLSFPFVYEYNNEIYILPEANESKTLYRYRAVEFPNKWVKEDALLTSVRLADTTPIREYDYNLALTYDLNDDSLNLVDLDNKTLKLIDHDPKGLKRPAGFIKGIAGIRAAQECGDDYGKGIIFYRYELTQDQDYIEKEIRRVHPQDVNLSEALYLDGMHTYNRSKHFEVIDIKTRRFNILNFIVRLRRAFIRKKHIL